MRIFSGLDAVALKFFNSLYYSVVKSLIFVKHQQNSFR